MYFIVDEKIYKSNIMAKKKKIKLCINKLFVHKMRWKGGHGKSGT